MDEPKEIGSSVALIYKVQTTIDGGARITLDLPSVASDLAKQLLEMKLLGREMVAVGFVYNEESCFE